MIYYKHAFRCLIHTNNWAHLMNSYIKLHSILVNTAIFLTMEDLMYPAYPLAKRGRTIKRKKGRKGGRGVGGRGKGGSHDRSNCGVQGMIPTFV
jgi:hypothetical protein